MLCRAIALLLTISQVRSLWCPVAHARLYATHTMRAAKASPPPARAGNDNSHLFRSSDGLDTAPLIDYLAKWKAPFEKSQVYKVATEELILDETARMSSIRRTKDPVLFALCDKLLLDMTAGDQDSLFVIHRTDASHIQYLPGGKFEKHRDYLSVTSNMIEEWTLLISVNKVGDAVRGGETKIDINALNSVISKASVTPGSALLFRKDLEHEGMLVTAGSKAILSLDVWKVVQADRQRRIVHVTFPKGGRGGDQQEQPPGLQEISDSSFALPVTRVLLSSPVFRHFLLMQSYWTSESLILPFECREFNQATFKPVFQVLSGGYVSREDADKHRSALGFFGLELDSILVSMSNKENVKNEEELQWESDYVDDDDDDDDVDDIDDDVDDETSSRKERRHVAPIDKKPISTDDLIICTSPEQTDVLADIVRPQRLPYLRFRAIFAEGRVRSNLQMVPCYLALGDHENILFLQTALEWDCENKGDMHTLPKQNLVDALGAAEIAEIGLEEGKGAGVRETEEEQETTVAVGKSVYDLSALPGKLKTPNTRVQLVNFHVGRERSFSN